MSTDEGQLGLHRQVFPGWYSVSQPQGAAGTPGEVGRLHVVKDGENGAMIENWHLYLEDKPASDEHPQRFKFMLLGTNELSVIHLTKGQGKFEEPTDIKRQFIKAECSVPLEIEAQIARHALKSL